MTASGADIACHRGTDRAAVFLADLVVPAAGRFWWWLRLLLTIYSVRIARLRALEHLRLRIARDLHDEVGANLGHHFPAGADHAM